jgi:hypothetical protein
MTTEDSPKPRDEERETAEAEAAACLFLKVATGNHEAVRRSIDSMRGRAGLLLSATLVLFGLLLGRTQASPWVSLLSFLLLMAAAILLVMAFAARDYGEGMFAKTLHEEMEKFGWTTPKATMRLVSTMEACDKESILVVRKTGLLITVAMTLLVADMLLLWADSFIRLLVGR